MDASTLRWILIVVGLVVIGSIFLFGNPKKKAKPKASRKPKTTERQEPTLDGSAGEESSEPITEEDVVEGQGELNIEPAPSVEEVKPAKPRKPAGPPPDKIITLFLLAQDNHVINGAQLLQAVASTGMEFGDMNIFHRIDDRTEKTVFSMANASKPGHFERDEWNTFESSGVVLFMTLPGPVNALDAWDSMLATARRISEVIHADLLDDERAPFSRQREAQLREEMREYDRNNPKPQ